MAIQVATATFNGSQDSVSVTWPTPFDAAPTSVTPGIAVTDGSVLDVAITNVTTTGCDVTPTGRFNGVIPVIAIA